MSSAKKTKKSSVRNKMNLLETITIIITNFYYYFNLYVIIII